MMAKQYPEHEKLEAVKDESQTIGEFLEWLLSEHGVTLCRYEEEARSEADRYVIAGHTPKGEPIYVNDETGDESPNIVSWNRKRNPDYWYKSAGFYPLNQTIETVLASYFRIDLKKIAAEKEAIYQELRKQAERVA